jgi:biopolymer transport protein ExbD
MIDVVFQLILFFLVSTTFAMLPGIALNLPESTTAEAAELTPFSVTIINRDEIYLNKDRIALKNLEAALINLSQTGQTNTQNITLEADESVSYGLIIEVLDILRQNGFSTINLHTIKPLSKVDNLQNMKPAETEQENPRLGRGPRPTSNYSGRVADALS